MSAQHTPGPLAFEIWIKGDPVRTDGVGDTQCTIRSRDGAWRPMKSTTDRSLAEWNLRDLVKCNPGIASHYEIREVAKATLDPCHDELCERYGCTGACVQEYQHESRAKTTRSAA